VEIDFSKVKKVSNPNMTWLNAHRRELEKNYPGQWVAISGDQVVGWGSIQEASQMARKKGIERPLLTAFRRLEDQGKVFIGAHRKA